MKYLSILSASWKNGLVYRTSLLMWRLRQFFGTFMSLSIWLVIFGANDQFQAYSKPEMITYVLLVALIQNIVLSSALNGLANTVYSGELSYMMLKPVAIFYYFATLEIADKAKNFFFVILETLILFFLYKPELTIPSLLIFSTVMLLIVLATLLNFIITLAFGSVGFWSPDTWAPRFIFFMVIEFTAGRLFPLDILPQFIQNIVYLTPFPYLSFVQTQLFLGRIPADQAGMHVLIISFWISILGAITWYIWQQGLRRYAAAGQ